MQHQLLRTIRDEHQSLAAMLDALQMVLARGPGDAPERYFELVASMLVYIKEFSEHVHFPKEVELLFPTVLEVAPDTVRAVARLEKSHRDSIAELVDLQTLLAAWQEDGDDSPQHRTAFEHATARVRRPSARPAPVRPAHSNWTCSKTRNGADWWCNTTRPLPPDTC